MLSGMSNIEQMADNLSYMKDFRPLNTEEQAAVRKAQEINVIERLKDCAAVFIVGAKVKEVIQ